MILDTPEIKFGGKFGIRKYRADGSECDFLDADKKLRSGHQVKNALLDSFFTELLSTNSTGVVASTFYLKVGTSAVPVDFGQTGLLGYVGQQSASTLYSGLVEDGFLKVTVTATATFALGALNGNFSEVGARVDGSPVANATTNSRALITDALGDPTSITVSLEEQLVLTYELTFWVPYVVQTGVFDVVVNGTPVETTYEVTPSSNQTNINSRNFLANVGLAIPIAYGTALIGLPGANLSSTAQSYGQTGTVTHQYNVTGGKNSTWNLSISQINGDIQGVLFPWYKYTFNPKLPKTNARTLALTFRQTFGRL